MENRKLGILLSNIGTPASYETKDVRRYLREFLSDPRVIQIPKLIWWPILNGFILTTRPKQSARLYKEIWTKEGSPLLTISLKQAAKLENHLKEKFDLDNRVVVGMRYGEPSIKNALLQLRQDNVSDLIILPMFPQFSGTTSASVFDAVAEAINTCPHLPAIRYINHYYQDPNYIDAITQSIKNHWNKLGKQTHLLFSYHGLPQDYVDKGDPYQQQCQTTAELIAKQLQLTHAEWNISYQSRLGPKKWLQPYTDKILAELPKQNIKELSIICPGFATDCLETLEEIALRNLKVFMNAGGKAYYYIDALNDSDMHIKTLANLII